MLNVNLLLIKEYRDNVFRELKIPPLDFEPMTNEESYEKFRQAIIKHVNKNEDGRPVYAAVTVSKPYTETINKDLYLTGLAYQYSKKKIDNISILENNVEELFLLDYLKEYFAISDISVGNVKSMNGNYLLPFAALSLHYSKIGCVVKAQYYKDLALKVATDADRLEEYETYFNKE